MSSQTVTTTAAPVAAPAPGFPTRAIVRVLTNSLLTVGIIVGVIILLSVVLKPLIASTGVTEEVTTVLPQVLVFLLPYITYLAIGWNARSVSKNGSLFSLVLCWILIAIFFAGFSAWQYATQTGPFTSRLSLQFEGSQTDDGILVESVEDGGTAAVAGLQPGDVITAIRRDPITLAQLNERVAQAAVDDPFRLRIMRNGEEIQLTVPVATAAGGGIEDLVTPLIVALIVGTVGVLLPSATIPFVVLIGSLIPLFLGYLWLLIATFSTRTHGLFPVDREGNIGGWTLDNWGFLTGKNISSQTANVWMVTANSLLIAVVMMLLSLTVSSMAGYALSRMKFPGRKFFLSMTLVLHGFPAVTLIIPIFLVLINLGAIPIIGKLIGFNTPGGIAMVMVAFELPLGIWLMKGFFDNISWDMERSALIDGASRFRTFREIILPQIRPGLLALGIFSFISGWNAYLIPATYSIGTGTANLPVFINQISGEVAPVNWNMVAAVGIFQLIPIFTLFVFAQEYLLNIYAGGTKGTT